MSLHSALLDVRSSLRHWFDAHPLTKKQKALILACFTLILFGSFVVAFIFARSRTNKIAPESVEIVQEQMETSPSPEPTASASATPEPTNTPTLPLAKHQQNLLVIGFDPTENGRSLVETYYSSVLQGKSVTQFEDQVFRDTVNDFATLSNGSVRFSIKKKLRITDLPVYSDGFSYSVDSFSECVWGRPNFNPQQCEARKKQFDHTAFVRKYNLCQIIKDEDIDAIWMLAVPYITTWESFIIGPTEGFFVNGGRYQIPECDRHIVVLNGTYDRPETVLHSFGHQVEATLTHVFRTIMSGSEFEKHWSRFARWDGYKPQTENVCGNTHFPTNATSDYEYAQSDARASSCVDWKNFPNHTGVTQSIGCSAWGCNDRGWQRFWLGALPSGNGRSAISSAKGGTVEVENDWWYYILDPDFVIQTVSTF